MDVDLEYFTKKHWNRVAAARGTRSSDVGTLLVQSLVELVAEYSPDSVLDIGAGNGLLSCALANRLSGARVVGLDYSDEAIQIAREQFHPAQTRSVRERLSFSVGSASELPHDDDSFDAVTLLKTAWVLPDLRQALRESARVLRPGGRIFVQTWGAQRDCAALTLAGEVLGASINGLQVPDSVMGPFYLTPDRTRNFLADAGLPVIDRRSHAHEIAVRSASEYWDRLRTIAGSAYWSLSVQPEVDRAALDADWVRCSAPYRDAQANVRLPLSWDLTVGGGQ
jgi:SAM-dependent methyltransferase